MLLLLIVIGLGTSQNQIKFGPDGHDGHIRGILPDHAGWQITLHRLGLDSCNALKSKILSTNFCGVRNVQCELSQGLEIIGPSNIQGMYHHSPNVEFHDGYFKIFYNLLDPDWLFNEQRDSPCSGECDVIRFSALVGAQWENIDRATPTTLSIKIGSQHRYTIVIGNVPTDPDTLTQKDGRIIIEVMWETLIELYVLYDADCIGESHVDVSIQVNDPTDFSPNVMTFKHSQQWSFESVTEGRMRLGSKLLSFDSSLHKGIVSSVSAKCTDDIRGDTTLLEEVLQTVEGGQYVASCSNGYRSPKFTMRKPSSKMSAIAVCVNGDDGQVYSELPVNFAAAVSYCKERKMSIPKLSQVQSTDFCNKIAPFGHFYYIWVTKDSGVEDPPPQDIETFEDIISHSEIFEDYEDQDAIIVDVSASTTIDINGVTSLHSSEFPQMMDGQAQWGIVAEYTYPKECHVLETKVIYEPLHKDFAAVETVSRWVVARRNGLWTYAEFFHPKSWGGPANTRDFFAPTRSGVLEFIHEWQHDGDDLPQNPPPSDIVKLLRFGEVNHISGDTMVHPHSVPRSLHVSGDHRLPDWYGLQRGYLAVDAVSECSMKVVTTYQEVRLHFYDAGMDSITAWAPVFDDTPSFFDFIGGQSNTWQQTATFIPGRYTLFEVEYYNQGFLGGTKHQTNLNFNQASLLWDCGEGFQVVPRLNIFSAGARPKPIISDKVHLNIDGESAFKLGLASPPTSTISVVCTGPSSVVISPSVITYSVGAQSLQMRTVHVYPSVSYSKDQVNPDSFITCSSSKLEDSFQLSITLGMNDPRHLQVSPSGFFAEWFSTSEPYQWRVRDFQVMFPDGSTECVWSVLDFYSEQQFNFAIQTKHNSAEAYDITITPLTGVVFAYGPHVFGAYSSVGSNGWGVHRLSGLTNSRSIPKISRASLDDAINPGKLTVEFPCGSTCHVIPHGDHYMHLSCVISALYEKGLGGDPSDGLLCLATSNSFFNHPNAVTISRTSSTGKGVPEWPAGTPYEDELFATVLPPSPLQGKSLVFPEDGQKMTAAEVSTFKSWSDQLDQGVDFSPFVWNTIQSKCPLMSDKVVAALRPFTSQHVSNWITEVHIREFLTTLLKRCQADFFMQKFFSCLGPYQFNEDDAVQSFRSMVYYFVSLSRKASDNFGMMGRALTLLADNGMPGHLCSKRGHLVGSPPICACIGNSGSGNVYPHCPDTIDCPPATKWQLDMIGSFAYPTLGVDFCSAEKSIVIVPSLGVSINCYRGFCYYWSTANVRTGLKYEMCITPYCVIGYQRPDAATIVWYGLTECGETVVSTNNGDTWTISGNAFPADAQQEFKAIPVSAQKIRVPLVDANEYYEVDASDIVRVSVSSGKTVTVSMKWWCECIDPAIWNLVI